MNFSLKHIPHRTQAPRVAGLTMVNDKGLSLGEAQNMIDGAAPFIDMVKLGFGTALLTNGIKEKIRFYKQHDIRVFVGGLLFEAYVARGQFKDYLKLMEELELNWFEVSDGSLTLTHEEKCDYIRMLKEKGIVVSELGSADKDKVKVTPPYRWIELMKAELEAGSTYLIAEAKELGTEGIYRDSGEVREGLVEEILTRIPAEKIIWEAPAKDQQLYFVKLLGANANLGNIHPVDIISLETMRLGLRSDSFHFFLQR